jgi:hypothetical protein
MTRVPELRAMLEGHHCSASVREATEEELEELTKVMIPTLMEKLPSVLPRGVEDPAHGAAVADMLLELTRVSKPNLTGFVRFFFSLFGLKVLTFCSIDPVCHTADDHRRGCKT